MEKLSLIFVLFVFFLFSGRIFSQESEYLDEEDLTIQNDPKNHESYKQSNCIGLNFDNNFISNYGEDFLFYDDLFHFGRGYGLTLYPLSFGMVWYVDIFNFMGWDKIFCIKASVNYTDLKRDLKKRLCWKILLG